MKQIYLPKTQFHITVPDNIHYQDDGLVPAVGAHTTKLIQQYGITNMFSPLYAAVRKMSDIRTSIRQSRGKIVHEGGCEVIFPNFKSLEQALDASAPIFIHTFVLGGRHKDLLHFDSGHVEFHVPLTLKYDDELYETMSDEGFHCDEFLKLDTKLKCHIGGLIALIRENPSTITVRHSPGETEILAYRLLDGWQITVPEYV